MKNINRPLPESYWVVPAQLLAGEYPGAYLEDQTLRQMHIFLEHGFDTFIDLTSPGERPSYLSILKKEALVYGKDVRYRRFQIGDFGIPPIPLMRSILDEMDISLESGHKVYLHCLGGIGRTGTTVGCYLVRHGLSGEEALRQLADWWKSVPKSACHPKSPETAQQMKFILNWGKNEQQTGSS